MLSALAVNRCLDLPAAFLRLFSRLRGDDQCCRAGADCRGHQAGRAHRQKRSPAAFLKLFPLLGSEAMISAAERAHIVEGIKQGVRTDGRDTTGYRPLRLELGVLPQASGSARCQLGATDVLVGIKVRMASIAACLSSCLQTLARHTPVLAAAELSLSQAELGTPLRETPGHGGLQFAVECSPCGSVSFQVHHWVAVPVFGILAPWLTRPVLVGQRARRLGAGAEPGPGAQHAGRSFRQRQARLLLSTHDCM